MLCTQVVHFHSGSSERDKGHTLERDQMYWRSHQQHRELHTKESRTIDDEVVYIVISLKASALTAKSLILREYLSWCTCYLWIISFWLQLLMQGNIELFRCFQRSSCNCQYTVIILCWPLPTVFLLPNQLQYELNPPLSGHVAANWPFWVTLLCNLNCMC